MIAERLRRLESRAIGSYSVTAADLAIFRVLFAVFVLVELVPQALWIPGVPRAFFYPPLGPAALFTSTPPRAVLLAANGLLVLFAGMLLVGWRTVVATLGTALVLLFLKSWTYSLGKIGHSVLLVVAPLVLAFSGWGRALSVDASRRDQPAGARAEAWPLALLAMLIGAAMFSAGWAKATTGWLDPRLWCTYGHLVPNALVTGRETWAAALAMRVDSALFWKSADYAAVAVELAMLPAALHRRSFCVVLALAAIFHFGIWLLFDIVFSVNILVYGAFVRYASLPVLRRVAAAGPLSGTAAAIGFTAALAIGLAAIVADETVNDLLDLPLGEAILCLGLAGGVWYLLRVIAGPRGPAPAGVVPGSSPDA